MHQFDKTGLSKEQTILVAASRLVLAPVDERRILDVLSPDVDWQALWDLARDHGVRFFVSRHLQPLTAKVDKGWLPGEFVSTMRRDLAHKAAQSLALWEAQRRITNALEMKGLLTAWLKGLILSHQLYHRLEARHASDLDLLTDARQVPAVGECLRDLEMVPFANPEPGKDHHPLGNYHQVWRFGADTGHSVFVELHHAVSGPTVCQPRAADILARSRVVTCAGEAMRVPSAENELLLLCLHAHHHNFAVLRCLMDVGEYVQRFGQELDWELFFADTAACRALGRVAASLRLAELVLGPPLPDKVRKMLPQLSAPRRWAIGLNESDWLDAGMEQDEWRRARLWLLMDRWTDTLRLVWPRIAPSARYVHALYPSAEGWLPAYGWYAARIVRKGMRWLARRLWKTSNDPSLAA